MTRGDVQAVRARRADARYIDLFVYHQANGRIPSAVGERLGLPADRVVDCIAEHGNTSPRRSRSRSRTPRATAVCDPERGCFNYYSLYFNRVFLYLY